jgi:polyhydroxyalkanoate synthesis regulator phasin
MKSVEMNPLGLALDSWVASLGSVCWAQDQTEQIVSSWMSQGKVAREHGREVARQLSDQAKRNQVELQKFIHNSVALSLESMQNHHQKQMAEMQNQVHQMSKMMTDLQRKVDEKEN